MEADNHPALLSPLTAWLISAFFASSYVGSLYLFPAGRLKFNPERVETGHNTERARALNERWRNDPATIQARLSGVALSTLLSCLVVFTLVTKLGSWKVRHSKLPASFTYGRALVGRFGCYPTDCASLGFNHLQYTYWLLVPCATNVYWVDLRAKFGPRAAIAKKLVLGSEPRTDLEVVARLSKYCSRKSQ